SPFSSDTKRPHVMELSAGNSNPDSHRPICLLACDGPVPWQWTDDISAAADRSANSFFTSLYNPKPSHCNLPNSRTLPKVHVVWHSACRAYLQKELKLASFLCLQMRQAWKHLETDLFGWFKFSEPCCSS